MGVGVSGRILTSLEILCRLPFFKAAIEIDKKKNRLSFCLGKKAQKPDEESFF